MIWNMKLHLLTGTLEKKLINVCDLEISGMSSTLPVPPNAPVAIGEFHPTP